MADCPSAALLRQTPLHETPLHALHLRLGARMVDFAGWSMPVQYPAGSLAEHRQCREAAVLFDVSHMGQASIAGPGATAGLAALLPADVAALPVGRQCYSMLLNPAGGVIDDIMLARLPDRLVLVLNASRVAEDLAWLRAHLPGNAQPVHHENLALLALQGPAAALVLGRLVPALSDMPFMAVTQAALLGQPCVISRSGYTGGDGFEISLPGPAAPALAEYLLAQPGVLPAGLGARDTLRLEAGLCLYGQDLDPRTTPVEAGLVWTIPPARRAAGGFIGAAAIAAQLAGGPTRRRVGLLLEGRAIARAHTDILAPDGRHIGQVTSGGFSPMLGRAIAMGYVAADHAGIGTAVQLPVRGAMIGATIARMPFYRATAGA